MFNILAEGLHMRQEILTWNDVDKLIDHLTPQFEAEFEHMVIITRGGIVPGGLLAEVLNISTIFTASVDFPAEMESEKRQKEKTRFLVWPNFLQFPEENLLQGKRVLLVDDVWGSGRTITVVKNRVASSGGIPSTCVFHFNPYRNLFGAARPDYFAATTDAHIIYPWEINRGRERALLGDIDR
jgi:hypoxanthine phosphoribosyltransferase